MICVHSFSRFYRNGAEMELTIRQLRKSGVDVVSVTRPTGDDPSQNLMRQIIGIFDEYTSRENGKNVTRAMRESAKQGFWNGATPPLGYRIVEAERRGSKIKKRLDVDPVEAELVRLIYRLYSDCDGGSGPLGVKDTTKWLNSHGYRTRRGATFGVGPVHVILTNRCYATEKWPYGVRNSRTGQLHDPASVVDIDVPAILPHDLFVRVHARLAAHNPKITPPRVVSGPTLLTGLAVCVTCGAGMTRTRERDAGIATTATTAAAVVSRRESRSAAGGIYRWRSSTISSSPMSKSGCSRTAALPTFLSHLSNGKAPRNLRSRIAAPRSRAKSKPSKTNCPAYTARSKRASSTSMTNFESGLRH